VRAIVADTSPIHYLVLIGHSEILPVLFEKIIIPNAVQREMTRVETPAPVRTWIQSPPAWLEVWPDPANLLSDESLAHLDEREKSALALAANVSADLILIDDRAGRLVARQQGVPRGWNSQAARSCGYPRPR